MYTGARKDKLFYELKVIASQSKDMDMGLCNRESFIYKTFSLSSQTGRQLYQSLSDEDLALIINKRAVQLGRLPQRKEVFWVWRDYIKQRFNKWPKALQRAREVKHSQDKEYLLKE